MTSLFDLITLRERTARNRIWMSPMCMYSAVDGVPNDFHLMHLGARAVGGVGAIIAEATAVLPEGRITPADTGLWNDEQAQAWARIVAFQQQHGALAGVQLAHAGRKASTYPPGRGSGSVPASEGGWQTLSATDEPFATLAPPRAMTHTDIDTLVAGFANATQRALHANFDFVEIHAAHGYLLHQFYSPVSNTRTDAYGGSFDNRIRLLLQVTEAVRAVWPEDRPLLVRLSATDWLDEGWTIEDTVEVSRQLRERGVDLVDASSGGASLSARIPVAPGYQVPLAARVRADAALASGAVGMITTATQAQQVLDNGAADVVLLGRALLNDPHWALHAAHELGVEVPWARQYERGRPS